MKKDMIYFGKSGLTSTSANYIANKAKESIASEEAQLSNLSFVSSTVGLLSSDTQKMLSLGVDSEKLQNVKVLVDKIAKMKSLCAWIREALKAKDRLVSEAKSTKLCDWCIENGIEYQEMPDDNAPMTEDDYIGTLGIKQRNEYYETETMCSVIGKLIHDKGPYNKARKELAMRLLKPNEIVGNGADAMIYTYCPSVSEREVDNMFFFLNKKYRESQAKLNKMKFDIEKAANDSQAKTLKDNSARYAAWKVWYEETNSKFLSWKHDKLIEIQNMKIVIPSSLADIFKEVNDK